MVDHSNPRMNGTDEETDDHRFVLLFFITWIVLNLLHCHPRSPVGRAKHLTRIAVEYNQLLYHTAKARKQECEFLNQLQKVCGLCCVDRNQSIHSHRCFKQRMDRIESTLSRDLDLAFSATMISLTSSSSDLSTAARSRNTAELSECLKIYDMLGKWDSAEEVIRQDLVQPFVKKVCYI